MKKLFFMVIIPVAIIFSSCRADDASLVGEFEFISEYTTTVTVGGVIGIEDRTFKAGEVYDGSDDGGESIRIRIAEQTGRNADCQNSWCYQEFLDVPREHLRFLN